MKATKLIKIGLFLILMLPSAIFAQRGEKITTLVIDAGHGGKDSGAVGKTSKEKDIALAVALKVGNLVKKNLPDVKVIYTRSTDVFIPLIDRANIANKNNADVFISIHCNAAENTKAYGTETFVMGEHKNQANLEVAKRENSAILLEDDSDNTYGGFDPNSPESYILLSLQQNEFQAQSINLAAKIQDKYANTLKRHNRGVQQAGFLVLVRTAMTSILTEIGFISNLEEEKYIKSETGQNNIAESIYQAFKEFKNEYEARNSGIVAPVDTTKVTVPATDTAKVTPVITDTTATASASDSTKTVIEPVVTVITPETVTPKVCFKVQFASSAEKVNAAKNFPKVTEVESYYYSGAYRYTSGCFTDYNEALKRLNEIKKLGYDDSFMVAFSDGERISVNEAKQKLGIK